MAIEGADVSGTETGEANKIRVAILGGGPAGLAAAHGLSATPEQRDRYEVTVYQAGWRVGGKCGSGRWGPMNRIEQNGTHYLFGAYDNCFSLTHSAFEVLAEHDDPNFGTFEEQFIPRSLVAAEEFFRGEWHTWPVALPTNDALPGDTGEMPTLASVLGAGIQVLIEAVAGSRVLVGLQKAGVFPSGGIGNLASRVTQPIRRSGATAIDAVGMRVLTLAKRLVEELVSEDDRRTALGGVASVLRTYRSWLWAALKSVVDDNLGARRIWIVADLAVSVMVGAIEDDIFSEEGLEAIDQYDLREWLQRHGASEITAYSPPITAWYNAIAAYVDGNTETPNMSAAVGLHGLFRLGMTYKGAFTYQMAAEVGDSVVAPVFQALRYNGVHFAFFQRVWDLIPAEDGDTIEAVELEVQREITAGPFSYEPFKTVKGRSVWPDAPRDEQLTNPGACEPKLDSFFTPCDGPRYRIEAGKDFDVLIWAIPVGAIPEYAGKLLEQKQPWRDMVENLRITDTQSLRVWLKPSLEGLGWTHGRAVMSGYYQPLATWEDNSQLIDAETWPPQNTPGSMATLFGPLQSDEPFPGPEAHGYPASRLEEASAAGLQFLDSFVGPLWPDATSPSNAVGIDWEQLVVWDNEGIGAERYLGQAPRANVGPIEGYTQIHSGTLQYRLRTDQSGYENLYLAGDWVRNGLELGSVEGAVMSGFQASRAISGAPEDIPGSRGI